MMRALHTARYLWEIWWMIPCKGKQKKQILRRVETSVRNFVSERPNADYHMVTARFGTPKQIVQTCLEEMNGEELIRELNSRRKIVRIVLTTAVIVISLWAAVVILALAEHNSRANGYFVEQIVHETEVSDILEGE